MRYPANAIKILDLLRSRSRLELCPCWRSSGAEQLPCKQWVGGSNPPASASFCAALANERFSSHAGRFGEVPKWPKGADCKSAGERLRGFKSSPPHHLRGGGGGSRPGRGAGPRPPAGDHERGTR